VWRFFSCLMAGAISTLHLGLGSPKGFWTISSMPRAKADQVCISHVSVHWSLDVCSFVVFSTLCYIPKISFSRMFFIFQPSVPSLRSILALVRRM
jgi:hypothetical protein